MSGVLQAPVSIAIRPPVASDQAFIANTWWRNLTQRDRSPSFRRRVNYQIDRVLDDKTTRCLVACSQADANRIIGWLCYAERPRVLHYAYVRDGDRGRGVCTSLVAQAWPGSNARFIFTMKGPHTERCLERGRGVFVSIEEFWR